MAIKVLLADDSHAMLVAIRRVLHEESRIKIVGEARTFAEMMQMISDCKPEVLLLDLHLAEERHLTPEFVRSQLISVPCTLAVSFSNDDESQVLAESYGAAGLLDKMNLYHEMIPAIIGYGRKETHSVQLAKKARTLRSESSTTGRPVTAQS
jgi:chemotaxis response regulator CheB